MITAALLLIVATAQDGEPTPHSLDLLMQDVTEACLLPDLGMIDPRLYLSSHGWARKGKSDTFEKRIADARYSVAIEWPASKGSTASCPFDSDDTPAVEVYGWFRSRIGEPQDIVWSEQQIGGWKMRTNGHDAGVYVSRKRTIGDASGGMMLHVLQG
ncbi:hypothetical protein [uncultured Sphingomonas sp.]|uniref:hypothetical protein n=1 Tax=uncultured Sphingomonas sp. TaxID=158754 RepID=UPI0035C958FA